jgi:hypothetical protein
MAFNHAGIQVPPSHAAATRLARSASVASLSVT